MPWARRRPRVPRPRQERLLQMPVRCGDRRPRALTMQSRCLKTIRKPWRQGSSLPCQRTVQARAKVPTVHRQTSLAIRSLGAYCHLRILVPKPLPIISLTRSPNRLRKMPSRQKDSRMREWATTPALPLVTILRLKHSFRRLHCRSTRRGSWRTGSRTRRLSLS